MKKVLFVVMVCLLIAGPAFASGAQESKDSTESVPIIWAKSGPEGEAISAVAKVYTQQTGKPVNVVIQGRSGYRPAYNTALLAGSRDLDAVLDTAFVIPSLAAGGYIENLDSYISKADGYAMEDFQDVIKKEMKFNNSWYMFPTDVSSESMVYRTDLMDEPKSWDEFIETAKKFTKSINPDSPTQYGYAFAGAPGVLEGTFQGIMKAYGASIVDEAGNIMIDKKNAKDAFQVLVDMRNLYEVVPKDVTAWDYEELLTALQEGVVASAAFFTAGMPILIDQDQSPRVFDKIAYAPQPAGPNGSWTRINPLGVMVNKNGRSKKATVDFLLWVTGPEGAKAYTDAGGYSPRKSIMEDAKYNTSRPWIADVSRAAEQGVNSIRLAEQAIIKDTFNKWAAIALNGEVSVDEAFDNIAEELRDAL